MKNSLPIAYYLFLPAGLACVIGGIFLTRNTIDFVIHTKSTTGIVTDQLVRTQHQKRQLYCPQVEFITDTQRQVVFMSKVCGTSPYEIGQKFPVLYDTRNPYNASVDTIFTVVKPDILLWGVGIFLLYMFIRMYRSYRGKALLPQTGKLIHTTFVCTKRNFLYRRGFLENPYNVYTEWVDPKDRHKYVYISPNLWNDALKDYHTTEPVPVYIQPNNPNEYYFPVEQFKNIGKS